MIPLCLGNKNQCFCCQPEDPPNRCNDQGCTEAFGSLSEGQCTDVTNADWRSLASVLDLAAQPPQTGAREEGDDQSFCKGGDSKECCRCFKKKTCQDDGCNEAFEGEGVCVDVMTDDLSHIDTSVEVKPGLCKNKVNNNCCTCFRKLAPPDSCHLAPCSFAGVQGVCVGRDEVAPEDHVLTKGVCKGRGCSCWVPDTCRSVVHLTSFSSLVPPPPAGTLSVRTLCTVSVSQRGHSLRTTSNRTIITTTHCNSKSLAYSRVFQSYSQISFCSLLSPRQAEPLPLPLPVPP